MPHLRYALFPHADAGDAIFNAISRPSFSSPQEAPPRRRFMRRLFSAMRDDDEAPRAHFNFCANTCHAHYMRHMRLFPFSRYKLFLHFASQM